MPLIMEEGINMDDLFGEGNALDLGLPPAPAPPPKGLAQCLDEMRLLGCRQKVAWSRLGCIAYISADGVRVGVRYLQSRPSDGKWVLSEESLLHPVTEAHNGNLLLHLAWNETGAELAVTDCLGRVSIYSISMALNSINGLRQASFDSSDDSNQIVGLMWLNTSRSVHAFHQAAKVNGRWAYSPFRRRPVGPFHPANKGALICVTRAGQIRLLYQNPPDSRWHELPAELKNTGYSDRLLTHAAMVATQGGILLATHSVCQKICLYRIMITWNPPTFDMAQAKQSSQYPIPSFHISHCKVDMPSTILNVNRGADVQTDQSMPFPNSLYSLTRLEITPGQADSPAGSTASLWIMAVFSKPLHATPEYPDQQGPPSVIVRWQLESAPQAFHPKFDEVATKKNNAQAKPKAEMRRLEDIHCDKYIVSVDLVEHGTALAITHDDSSISFYDTRTMALFNGLDDASTVTCLAQAGFHYPIDTPGLSISFSPNSAAAVALDSEGQPRLRWMEHTFGSAGGLYDESKFAAAIAALTLAFSRGSGGDINTDDIVMVALKQLSTEAHAAFISEIYRALPVNCNFSADQEKLMSHPYVPRCLSLQATLGFKGRLQTRRISSAVPWAVLQFRHTAMLCVYFFQNAKGVQGETFDPDILRMLLGNTKWALDFSFFILSGIFDLADEFDSVSTDQEAFNQKLKTTSSLPLIILLSGMSRAFLRLVCRGLRGVQTSFTSLNPVSFSRDSRIYYTEICQTLDKSPVRIDKFEKFLAGVDSAVKHAYQNAGFGDAEKPSAEKELLLNARIPPVLVPAVHTLLLQTVPTTKAEINCKHIVLGDYSWLGLGSDARTLMYRRRREVDILKKTPLRPLLPPDRATQTQKRRRCVRCCEVSGETVFPRSIPYFKMIAKLNMLRTCPCGGVWIMECTEPTAAQGPEDLAQGASAPPGMPGSVAVAVGSG
ncbi:Mediator complex subunit Med16 [Penicillium macrosclerotiorum]|uniref:Mediator complex subunit Med16 n=1 Tax=Penicillium macrosclerotiorum TaxID=303699 RepID=UPI002548D42F|nr:Mediator complex subunit Med16 [Penicillium macrosclerotiorum]KAJ5664605.1 Mediator complex subunit Med16 [Penicillium macrosclerotiorum]